MKSLRTKYYNRQISTIKLLKEQISDHVWNNMAKSLWVPVYKKTLAVRNQTAWPQYYT